MFEHPKSARSWKEPELLRLAAMPGTIRVETHMCAFGMTSEDSMGTGLVKKSTVFLTNCPRIAEHLDTKCTNCGSDLDHRHVHLVDGRAAAAQQYPVKLCRAICRGLREQIDEDECEVFGVNVEKKKYWDDITGQELDPENVRIARALEVEFFHDMHVYDKVPISECIRVTGKRPIKCRWVDVLKKCGTHRSRRAGKEDTTHNCPGNHPTAG